MKRHFTEALLFLAITAICTACGIAQAGMNDANQAHMPESCEIHLLLDAGQLLDDQGLLTREACGLFDVTKKHKTYSLAYVETPDMSFKQSGWINRIRMQQGKANKGYSLTYKKRYPVHNGDVASAMRLAESEGFGLSGKAWDTQLEWSYSSMTLSLSTETTCPADGRDCVDDLDSHAATGMIRNSMPEEETEHDADTAQMVGPVFFKRYSASYLDRNVRIEVWDVPMQGSDKMNRIVELSYETTDLEDAAADRDAFIRGLTQRGLLLQHDALKTQQVLDAFLGSAHSQA